MADDNIVNGAAANAIAAVNGSWARFRDSCNPLDQAEAIIAVNNAMADLISYHPHFDVDTGELREPALDAGDTDAALRHQTRSIVDSEAAVLTGAKCAHRSWTRPLHISPYFPSATTCADCGVDKGEVLAQTALAR